MTKGSILGRGSLLRAAMLFFATAPLGACATLWPSDAVHEQAAIRNVRERAPFDLQCKDPTVTKLGDVARLGQQMTRTSFGVTCAGKQASYVVTCVSNYGKVTCTPELNSDTKPTGP